MSGKPRKQRIPRKATPEILEEAAHGYIARYATTSAHLRRVLMRRVDRSVRFHGTDAEDGAVQVDRIVARLAEQGLLDDAAYGRARANDLHRRGASARMIRHRLREKGLGPDLIEDAIAALGETVEDPERAAAAALVRRRRIGPYRSGANRAEFRMRDLAALARAGFDYDLARRVIDAESPDSLDAEC